MLCLKQCQEEIVYAKSLGFDLFNNMGYIELDFLGNVQRELSSEKMSFPNNGNLHGETEDFVRCQDLCISHRKNCP